MEHRPVAIFDMDGTLIDSMYYWQQAPLVILNRAGVTIDDALEEAFYSHRLNQTLAEISRQRNLALSGAELFAQVEQWMLERYRDSVLVKTGIGDYLRQLRRKGVSCVLLTNSPRKFITACFELFDLGWAFEKTYSVRELPVDKGNPEIYDIVCRDLAVAPEDCVLFEDSGYAVETAKEAGVRSVGILDPALTWNHALLIACCVRTVRRWSDLLDRDVF